MALGAQDISRWSWAAWSQVFVSSEWRERFGLRSFSCFHMYTYTYSPWIIGQLELQIEYPNLMIDKLSPVFFSGPIATS